MIHADLTPQGLSLIVIIYLSLHTHLYIEKKNPMIEIPQEHIRENTPIVYTFYGHYNIDQTTEGPYLSYNYIILTPSPGVGNT